MLTILSADLTLEICLSLNYLCSINLSLSSFTQFFQRTVYSIEMGLFKYWMF